MKLICDFNGFKLKKVKDGCKNSFFEKKTSVKLDIQQIENY
jgi:hypothetical protein